jgi:ATP-dependent DNA helicase RecQ
VSAQIHLAPPGSIEAYYQEAGRAGRDGRDAVCLLLISPGDMALRRRLLESETDGRVPDPAVVEHKWNLFLELMRLAEGGSCRHDAILRYFGDEAETLSGCGRCDVCQSLDDEQGPDAREIGTIVRKALCAVARVHGRFGIRAAARLLHGASDPRLERSGLQQTRTFGALSEYSEEWLLKLLRRCVSAGWVDFHGGDRPVVLLTEEGSGVIHEKRPARLLLPPSGRPGPCAAAARSPRVAASSRRSALDDGEFDARAQNLFDDLRGHRLELARAEGVPPYIIASDRTLRDIALLRPASLDELLLAHGIGPAKAEKYGPGLLAVVNRG